MNHLQGRPESVEPHYSRSLLARQPRAEAFARQILETTAPYRTSPPEVLHALDIGCGLGGTAAALARRCRRVVGLEPSRALAERARALAQTQRLDNLEIREQSLYELEERETYDLVILDNVLEHLPDQPRALAIATRALRPGGTLYLLVPNRLWPIEHHYGLPGLGWLPLGLANHYLRATGRGADYTDASYAPTLWRLRKLLRGLPALDVHFVVPADLSLTVRGAVWSYRVGAALLRRWAISKSFLVVGVRR